MREKNLRDLRDTKHELSPITQITSSIYFSARFATLREKSAEIRVICEKI